MNNPSFTRQSVQRESVGTLTGSASLGHVVCAVVLLAVACPHMPQAHAKVYHVNGRIGHDGYVGTEAAPLKTIKGASKLMEPGDTCIIHEGIYREQIMGGRSGTEGSPITYQGVDRDKVILQGSVTVKDWKKQGPVWIKSGLEPITDVNAFVMVDEKRMLQRVSTPENMPKGSFHLAKDGTYTIRLWKDADPNRDHTVEVYELDIAFHSGDRWGGTAKQWIVLRTLTLEKYGGHAVSTDSSHPVESSHWELDRITVRHNNNEGVFHCLDDWYVHDCAFIRNRSHGCQIDGARVRFTNNYCGENLWHGAYPDGGCGLLIGPDASAHECLVRDNIFENNGGVEAYGCGIYMEGRSHHNLLERNLILGGSHSGIGFFGSSHNTVINNILVDIAPAQEWRMAAAFVVGHSFQGEPTQAVGNLVAHNTIWGCSAPIAAEAPSQPVEPLELNRFVNNVFARCRFPAPSTAASGVKMEHNACFACPDVTEATARSLKDRLRTLATGTDDGGPCSPGNQGVDVPDPGFRNPTGRDFSLKAGSPLIDAGIVLPEVTVDWEGVSRPTGAGPDIGAHEAPR